jgi:predicted transcriptional regulator
MITLLFLNVKMYEMFTTAPPLLRQEVRELLDYIKDLLACILGELDCSNSVKQSKMQSFFQSRKAPELNNESSSAPWKELEK